MEGLYLICSMITTSVTSIITTSVTSIALSLLLPLQFFYSFFLLRTSSTSSPKNQVKEEEEDHQPEPVVSLYEGSVWHERRRPVHHSFRLSARYALLDLDRAPKSLPSSFFSNHISAQEAREITSTTGPVFLLTIPPSVGYEQNPLSVYYCYDLEGSSTSLAKCIAEVTNAPWGERVSFVFNPDSDLVAKPMHVSPFMDMLGNWSMRANAPSDNLFIAVSIQHPKLGDYFTATLNAKRVSSSGALNPALFFWLMPHKVALWIYWQALKLWWKNVHFVPHPRYVNSTYREEASMRDRKLQCCPMILQDENNHHNFDSSYSNLGGENNSRDRWCVWRDAQWPTVKSIANNFSFLLGGNSGNACFKCGQLGHWACDCTATGLGLENPNDGVPEKPCPCGVGTCSVLTANTGKNRGRKFYKCPAREENGGCGFFEWCDNSPATPMSSGLQYSESNSSFPDFPSQCGAGSCLVLTAKSGQNAGQQFYRCPAN